MTLKDGIKMWADKGDTSPYSLDKFDLSKERNERNRVKKRHSASKLSEADQGPSSQMKGRAKRSSVTATERNAKARSLKSNAASNPVKKEESRRSKNRSHSPEGKHPRRRSSNGHTTKSIKESKGRDSRGRLGGEDSHSPSSTMERKQRPEGRIAGRRRQSSSNPSLSTMASSGTSTTRRSIRQSRSSVSLNSYQLRQLLGESPAAMPQQLDASDANKSEDTKPETDDAVPGQEPRDGSQAADHDMSGQDSDLFGFGKLFKSSKADTEASKILDLTSLESLMRRSILGTKDEPQMGPFLAAHHSEDHGWPDLKSRRHSGPAQAADPEDTPEATLEQRLSMHQRQRRSSCPRFVTATATDGTQKTATGIVLPLVTSAGSRKETSSRHARTRASIICNDQPSLLASGNGRHDSGSHRASKRPSGRHSGSTSSKQQGRFGFGSGPSPFKGNYKDLIDDDDDGDSNDDLEAWAEFA